MEAKTSLKNKMNSARVWPWIRLGAGLVLVLIIFYSYWQNPQLTTGMLNATLRQSTPLILGALCGLLGERSGVVNIGIEGQMLLSAFAGFLVAVVTRNLFLGVMGGMMMGAFLGLFLAFMSVTLKMDQIIGGTVINILALGLTSFFYQSNQTIPGKLAPVSLGPLADLPLVGPVLFRNPPITYTALILVMVVHYGLFYTRWGLRTRAVGEHPRAADTVGINVYRMRYLNVMMGGAIAGLAGVFLTLESVGSFERAMTNGRGFLALAVMIFGKWTPLGAWGAALLFGFAYALNNQLQLQFSELQIPPQFVGMLPYILTIVVLAGFVGRSRPPAASGQPYETE